MIERTITFGPGGRLVGTLCLPAPDAPRVARVAQILFNAGVVHRVGPHRINVRLARRLARRGIASLRFDLAGQGDSARPADGLSFEDQAVVDLRCAMDLLAAEAAVARFALFGFCSGGPHSYAAALADERVAGILLFDAFQYPTLKTRLNSYRARIRRRGFLRALTGWTWRQLKILPETLRGAVRGAVRGALAGQEVRYNYAPPKLEFAERLRSLHRRGVKLAFIYSSGYEKAYNYPAQFGDSFRGLGVAEIVSCEYLPHIDHTATLMATQAELLGRVEAFAAGLDGELRTAGA